MARFAFPLLLVVALGLLAGPQPSPADPPTGDAALMNTLVLQKAMQEARYFLQHGNDSKKAVDLLEEQLPRVNGNAEFLRLLRDAYRTHIKDLYLANQPAAAERYLDRLCVLEPGAAQDPSLRPAPEAPKKVEPPPAAKAPEPKAPVFPDFAKNVPFLKGATKTAQATGKPAIIRAQAEEVAPPEDPFDPKNQRELPAGGEKLQVARQLVAKADEEFKQKRYGQARAFYEQAQQVEPESVTGCQERWGYCVLSHVADQLNQESLPDSALGDMRQQVNGAVAKAPTLGKTGQWLLQQIEQRQKGLSAAPAAASTASTAFTPPALKHLGQNPEGWLVAETANFRIFHKQTNDLAEKVALIAERTRLEMYRKWFGTDAPAWQPRCELIVHSTGQEYAQMTGVSLSTPGHSRIESDKANAARVIARRMDMRLDSPGMLDAVLPHETTHVVIAGMFGPFPIPRWADEGIAVLTEPPAKVAQHRQNFMRCHQDGLLFGLKELMTLQDYPEPRRISAFYAQSVMLVDFLTAQKGPTVFTSFVRDGLRDGYENALQRHYGLTFPQLEQMWNQQVLAGQKLAAGT
jgi:hypothetical protein